MSEGESRGRRRRRIKPPSLKFILRPLPVRHNQKLLAGNRQIGSTPKGLAGDRKIGPTLYVAK
jgi:hypothetical protein